MEKSSHELNMLRAEINSEKLKYKKAMRNQEQLEDVKVIYLKIKKLEKQATLLIQSNKFT